MCAKPSIPGSLQRKIVRMARHERSRLPASVTSASGPVATRAVDTVRASRSVEGGAQIQIIAESISDEPKHPSAALLEIVFRDAQGRRLSVPNWPHISQRCQEFKYLEPGDPAAPALTHVRITAPETAVSLEVLGHRWKSAVNTHIVGDIICSSSTDTQAVLTSPTGVPLELHGKEFRQEGEVVSGATIMEIDTAVRAPNGSEASSPLSISFFDALGNLLPPNEEGPKNPQFGTFIQVEAKGEGPHQAQHTVDIPPRAAKWHLSGVDWNKKMAIFVRPAVVTFDADASGTSPTAWQEFLAEIPHNDRLIIQDTTAPPLGHATLSLRPNNLSLEYAAQGSWVTFIPFSTIQDQPARPFDRAIQLNRDEVAEFMDAAIRSRRGANNIYVCSSFPSFEAVMRVERAKLEEWKVVYEIRDDMEEFNRVGYSKWYHPLLEHRMLSIVDGVVTVSTALAKKAKVMCPSVKSVHVLPNGVKGTTVEDGAPLRTLEAAARRSNSRVVGYVGHLTPAWFDWPLTISAAQRMPRVTFEIIGHGAPKNLSLPPNVRLLGPRTHDELPEIVERWKVGLIPFIDSPLTRGVDPNKIYEYYSWGLRVVSARMGSVETYPSTWVYQGLDEFVEAMTAALHGAISDEENATISSFATNSTWAARAQQMIEHMEALA